MPKAQKHSEDFNDNNGYLIYLELTTTRNDPLINPHDRIQLQGWRANVDLIPILTKQYVSKYASEAEPRSLALSEVLYKALRSDNPNDPAVKAFQKLLIHTVGKKPDIIFNYRSYKDIVIDLPNLRNFHCSNWISNIN
ncbi:hypothetical protein RhiirB3_474050, partial [Rhizophagus irregularis]